MTKDIKSSSGEWDTLRSKWKRSSEIGRAIQYIQDAFSTIQSAIKKVEEINSKGYESIGTLNFSVTESDLDQLEEGRRKLESFCAGIHEELVIDIDTPFARKMAHFADQVFDISPEKITGTHKGTMDFGKPSLHNMEGISLYHMVMLAGVDEELRENFLEKYEELQETPSVTLQNAIVTAVIQSYEGMDVAEEVGGVLVIPPEDKALLVKYYEMLYEEDAKKMNKFLDPIIQAGYDEDVMNIKFLSYKADEPYRTLLFYAIPKLEITDCDDPDAWCFFGNIHVDLGKDGKSGIKDPRGSYYTFFHEIGHGVDDAIDGIGWFFSQKNDLHEIAKREVEDNIKGKIAKQVLPGSPNYEAVFKSIKNNDVTNLNAEQKKIYNKVMKEYRDQLFHEDPQSRTGKSSAKNCQITDVYGAFTDNTLRLESYGHDDIYWLTHFHAQELYAGYFATRITEYQTHHAGYHNFLPESTELLDQEMNRIAEKIGSEKSK